MKCEAVVLVPFPIPLVIDDPAEAPLILGNALINGPNSPDIVFPAVGIGDGRMVTGQKTDRDGEFFQEKRHIRKMPVAVILRKMDASAQKGVMAG